jgi:hypothetical protein
MGGKSRQTQFGYVVGNVIAATRRLILLAAMALAPTSTSASDNTAFPWTGEWCDAGEFVLSLKRDGLATAEEAGCDFNTIEPLRVGNAWQISGLCYFDSGPGRPDMLLLIVDQSPVPDRAERLIVDWTGAFYHRVQILERCTP